MSLISRLSVVAVACLSGVASVYGAADPQPVITVPASTATLYLSVPVVEGFSGQPGTCCRLVEVGGSAETIVGQLVAGMAADGTVDKHARLVVAIPPRAGAGDSRRFHLEPADPPSSDSRQGFRFEDASDKSLKILDGQRPVMVYNHGVITDETVPPSDHRRSRGCYVHPLWGLSGEVLTDDFPKDHYHHHGIFWTWPHVGIDGQEHDLWAGNTIQDRFVGWIYRQSGPVAAVLAVENGWFVGEHKVMIERVWLRACPVADDARVLDLDFTWVPVDRPITLRGAEGKSYGGLTVRFAPLTRADTLITAPAGRTTDDLPDTPLAWADFTSKFGKATAPSGAAIFISPDHPDHPPTWLTRHYGAMCVGWPGVNAKTFPPGKPIRLSYRIWIHTGAVDSEALKGAYEAYLLGMKPRW